MVNKNDVIVMSDADAFVNVSDLFAPITERQDKLMWLLQFDTIGTYGTLPMAFTAAKIKNNHRFLHCICFFIVLEPQSISVLNITSLLIICANHVYKINIFLRLGVAQTVGYVLFTSYVIIP